MIIPSWEGSFGTIRGMVEFAAVCGSVDGTGGEDYDVAGFAFFAGGEINLGKIRPFATVAFGSADDDATDNDLNGFHHIPQREITLGNRGLFGYGLLSPSNQWGPSAGANAGVGGGVLGANTVANFFLDRLGNTAHPGTSVTYSNAGTLRFAVGTHIAPLKGHNITVFYQYVGFLDDATLNAITPGDYDKALFHEITGAWSWTVNSHFDIRAIGNVFVPGSGTEDIAATVDCNGTPCKGEDIALRAELRLRGRF